MPRLITEDRSMKRKMVVVVLLVLVCLGVLVVEGVSQPVPPPSPAPAPVYGSSSPSPASPPPAVVTPEPSANFSVVQPQQQEWTFEQLVEALKGVRARQKELQTQETDILANLAEKVEEKRQDLSKSETTLQQLRSDNGRMSSTKRIEEWREQKKK
jgi:ABC-type transport system substrate-binding protein